MEAMEGPAGCDAHCQSAARVRALHRAVSLSSRGLDGELERANAPGVLSHRLSIIQEKASFTQTPSSLHLACMSPRLCSRSRFVFCFSGHHPPCVCVRDRRNRHPRGCNLSPVICCLCCVCGLVIEPVRFEADIDSVIYLFLTFIAVAFLYCRFIRTHGYLLVLPAFSGTQEGKISCKN